MIRKTARWTKVSGEVLNAYIEYTKSFEKLGGRGKYERAK